MVTLHPHRQMTVELAADFAALAALRDRIRRWMQDADVDVEAQDDMLLVATELCTNAIEAGPPEAPIEVQVSEDGAALGLMVANAQSAGADGEPTELQRGSLQERGRGLAIVRSLVDTFVMTSDGGRTVVRAMRLL